MITPTVVFGGLVGAITWTLGTWRGGSRGFWTSRPTGPSSSTWPGEVRSEELRRAGASVIVAGLPELLAPIMSP